MRSYETYTAQIDAVSAQNYRMYGPAPTGDAWAGSAARQFRFDPRRDPDRNLAFIASYGRPDDVFVDVGGGAGRVCLPLALSCREAINVEPSPGMAAEFQSLAQEAFTADVTYFIRDIAGFISRLAAVANRRVMITVWSEPPPNRRGKLFRLIYGEEQEVLPGHRQLLPVLWDMGILPDVRVMPESPWWETQSPLTRDAAIQMILEDRVVKPADHDRARPLIESHFNELFASTQGGFVPLWRSDMHEMLITWETRA